MIEDLKALFEKHNDEFLEFERVKNKLSTRRDIHAFILLNQLLPDTGDILSAAEHDEVWLSIDVSDLAKVATEYQIIDLIRCGIRYDSDIDSLAMFV